MVAFAANRDIDPHRFIEGDAADSILLLQHQVGQATGDRASILVFVQGPFPVLHAVGNVLFAVWLAPSLHRLLWLHLRHDAGRWNEELPEDTQLREAFIDGAREAGDNEETPEVNPLSQIERLDMEVE